MKRRGTFIVLALAVAAVLCLFWAGRTHQIADNGESAKQAAPSGEQRSGESQPTSQREDRLEQAEGEPRSAGTQPQARLGDVQRFHLDRAPIAQPAGQPQPRVQAETQSPDVDSVRGVDFSVAGRPFPVSESILASCEPKPNERLWQRCKPNLKLLADMAEEPREEPWATDAERAIRGLVELEPGTELPRQMTYTIRALECRATICFVETSSIMGGFHTMFYYFENTSGLRAQYSLDSSETDADGTTVHVTLLPFVRQ